VTAALLSAVLTATAQSHPCQLYTYHQPRPIRTQFHHSKPVYLQNRLYDKIVYGPDFWVCGTCHDSLHETIDWMLTEGRVPNPMPGTNVLKKAKETVDWYHAELAKKAAGH
jgi:hypothetical protein